MADDLFDSLKGEDYEVIIYESDPTVAVLVTGIAQITFNRIDFGGGTAVLWVHSEPVCTLDMTDKDAKAIEHFIRGGLSPSYQ